MNDDERLRRWRLVLGGDPADGTGLTLSQGDRCLGGAFGALYSWVPAFAGAPDLSPEMMAAAIRKTDLNVWAAGAGIAAVPASAVD